MVHPLLASILMLVLASTSAHAAPATQPDLAAENERLKTKVRELEERVKQLESRDRQRWPGDRNRDLRLFEIPRFDTRPAPAPRERAPFWYRYRTPQFRDPVDGQKVPRDWQPRRFNGMTYYIVPLPQTPQ
jgi:hypothetical protein